MPATQFASNHFKKSVLSLKFGVSFYSFSQNWESKIENAQRANRAPRLIQIYVSVGSRSNANVCFDQLYVRRITLSLAESMIAFHASTKSLFCGRFVDIRLLPAYVLSEERNQSISIC